MNIKPEDIDDAFFDHVFLDIDHPSPKVDLAKLNELRKEFNYWYPMDLRCSGKDLIKNHLTMSLFNHQSVFSNKNMMPRGFFCNGYV